MSDRRRLPLVVLLGLALGGLGALGARGLRPPTGAVAAISSASPPTPTQWTHIPLGGGRALRAYGSRTNPARVQRVTAQDQALLEGWSWSSERPMRMDWSRRGPLVVGKSPDDLARHRTDDCLELFDADGGHLGGLPAVRVWCFAGDGVAAIVSAPGGVMDVAFVASGRTAWTTRLQTPSSPGLGATEGHVVAWSRSRAWALALADGAATDLGDPGSVVGLVRGSERVLALQGGQLVAIPVAGGPARAIDLTGGAPLLDGMHFEPPRPPGFSPRLLGLHAGRWIVSYATATEDDTESNSSWRTPATQHLAAIDPTSGRVVWRRTLGPFEIPTEPSSDAALGDDLLTIAWSEDEEHERTFWLGVVSLQGGELRWSTRWPAQGYSAEPRIVRRGAATYLVVAGLDRWCTLARFAGGRLTGALRTARSAPPVSLDEDEVWWPTDSGWVRLTGPRLSGPRGGPSAEEELERAAQRLRLPPAAR